SMQLLYFLDTKSRALWLPAERHVLELWNSPRHRDALDVAINLALMETLSTAFHTHVSAQSVVDEPVLSCLLDCKASVTFRGLDDRTPLHYVTTANIAAILIDGKADVKALDAGNHSVVLNHTHPMWQHQYSMFSDVVRLLLEHRADP